MQIFWLLECLRFVHGSGPSPPPLLSATSGQSDQLSSSNARPPSGLKKRAEEEGATQGGSWPTPGEYQAGPRPFASDSTRTSTENAVAVAAVAAEAAAQWLPDPPRVPFPPTRAASDENLLRLAMKAEIKAEVKAEVTPLDRTFENVHTGQDVEPPRQRAGIREGAQGRQAGQHDGGVSMALQDAMWAALEHDGTSDAGNGQDY